MISLLIIALLAQSPHDHHTRVNLHAGNRKAPAPLAFFEAFNSRGMGTFGACSTTAPTGAKGETLTFSRASSAVCTKTASGGLAASGIADGDLVLLSSNVARVEYDSASKLKLLVEPAGTNLLLQYLALDNAAWSDVGTPILTTGQADPFGGTAAVKVDDDAAGAFEGRSQSITVSAGAAYFMHCYVKAGTSTKARISIDGTTQDISGLSASTWSIVEKGDASASGVSIPIQILVGNAVTDVGSVIWGGCDVKTGTSRTSIVPTGVATATRAADLPFFTIPSTEIQCLSAVIQASGSFTANSRALGAATGAANTLSGYISGPGTSALHALQFVNPSSKDFTSAVNVTVSTLQRVSVWVNPSVQLGASVNGVESTTTAGVLGAVTGVTKIYPGAYEGGAGFETGGLVGEIQADPVFTRCTR